MASKKTKPPVQLQSITMPYITVKQGKRTLLLTSLPAGVVVKVSYAAVKRASDEEGAVQRPLNDKRIGKIRDFALHGGDFPACMILNWVNPKTLVLNKSSLKVVVEPRSAQLIDGQHRIAGLEDAIGEKKAVADMDIPVAIYRNLTTQECADIFLSINTEQKPVPKSLAYDLFGVASPHLIDPAAVRATDIAQSLHEDEESPYYRLVKYSGDEPPPGKWSKLGIPLSTFVNAIKPLVAVPGGIFTTFKVHDLKNQTKAITAFFTVLQRWYGDAWHSRDNVFMHATGITGGLDFFKSHMIPYCSGQKSYTARTMRSVMDLDPQKRIYKKEAERLGGRAMARTVKELLLARFTPAAIQEDDIAFD